MRPPPTVHSNGMELWFPFGRRTYSGATLYQHKFRKDALSCLHTVHLWTCHFYVIFRAFVVSCAPTLVERMHGLSSVKRVQHLLYGAVLSSKRGSALEYHIGWILSRFSEWIRVMRSEVWSHIIGVGCLWVGLLGVMGLELWDWKWTYCANPT